MGTMERVTRGWGRWSELHGDRDDGASYMVMGTMERLTRGWGWWSKLHGDGDGGASYKGGWWSELHWDGDGGASYTRMATVERGSRGLGRRTE